MQIFEALIQILLNVWYFPWIKLSWHSWSVWDKLGWFNWFWQFLPEGLSSSNLKGFYYSYAWSCSLCKGRTSFYMRLISRKLWVILLNCMCNCTSIMARPGGACYKMRVCIDLHRQDFQGMCNVLQRILSFSSRISYFQHILQPNLHDLLHPLLRIVLEREYKTRI